MGVPDGAGLDAVSEVNRSVEILGEDRGAEAVRWAVGAFNHFVQILELHDLHHWTKDLQTRTILHTYLLNNNCLTASIRDNLSGVFNAYQNLPNLPRHAPLLSLYGIIYVTWYTSNLPEATGVRLRLPNSHALLGSGRR